MKNRFILIGVLAVLSNFGLGLGFLADSLNNEQPSDKDKAPFLSIEKQFQTLEEKYDATLGIYAINPETKQEVMYHEEERFAYTSTYKAIAGGLILKNHTNEDLTKRIFYTEEDLVTYSPITEKHVADGMTVKELIHAAIAYSDNTAGNLLFDQLGGPKGFEGQLRVLGDTTTQADRYETELNEATPKDLRDTTTPSAFGQVFQKLMSGQDFEDTAFNYFIQTLKENTTGDNLIRAGVPSGYVVGDKTGAGGYGTRNDLAFIQSPKNKKDPLIWVIFSKKKNQEAQYDDRLIAEVAKVLSELYQF